MGQLKKVIEAFQAELSALSAEQKKLNEARRYKSRIVRAPKELQRITEIHVLSRIIKVLERADNG